MYIEEWLLQKLLREREEEHSWTVFKVPFYQLTSESFELDAQEMKAYEMPITKIIEMNSVKEMYEALEERLQTFIECSFEFSPASKGCF
jgi:hypothetical protein